MAILFHRNLIESVVLLYSVAWHRKQNAGLAALYKWPVSLQEGVKYILWSVDHPLQIEFEQLPSDPSVGEDLRFCIQISVAPL